MTKAPAWTTLVRAVELPARVSAVAAVACLALTLATMAEAQTEAGAPPTSPYPEIVVAYVHPESPEYQDIYELLQRYRALENVKQILSLLRLPEVLTIKTAECRAVNAWYSRESLKPTVTICYELLRHILESLLNETEPAGVTPADAAVGQFLWVTLHEVGHAAFDMFDIPILGHAEDAADNFATYFMLQMRKEQARRLVLGAAWAWRAYLGDYRKNPMVPLRLSAFADDHGLPQERFYNLSCLAFGAWPDVFAELQNYLPLARTPHCAFEYRQLVHAFERQIGPHIDPQTARRVRDADWLSTLETKEP
jgi:hypothetical protein